jgi:hypothetical protein
VKRRCPYIRVDQPFFYLILFFGSGRDVALASPRSTMLMASTPGRNERNNNDRPSVRPFIRPFVRSSVRLYRVGPAHMADNLGRCIDNSRRRDQRFKNVRGNKPTTAPNGGTWIFPTKTFRDSRTNASPLFSCTTDTCDRNVPSKNHRPVLRLVQAPFELNIQWKLVRTCYYVRIEYQRNIWCSRFSPERE